MILAFKKRFLITSGLLLASGPALAQQEMIPLELVQHLTPGFFPGEGGLPQILVGSMPEGVEDLVMATVGNRVIGSAVYSRSSRIVLGLPAPADAVIETMQDRLLAAGWSRPQSEERGGFLDTRSPENSTFCGPDGGTLNVLPGRRTAGGEQVVMIMHNHDTRMTACDPAARPGSVFPANPIPALRPPAGARVQGTGSGGRSDDANARATVRSRLSPQDLVRHYSGQLREHGWTPVAETNAADHATQSWMLTDAEGNGWFGILMAQSAPEEDHRSLWLRIERVIRRP